MVWSLGRGEREGMDGVFGVMKKRGVSLRCCRDEVR